jgi:hypothetical protein
LNQAYYLIKQSRSNPYIRDATERKAKADWLASQRDFAQIVTPNPTIKDEEALSVYKKNSEPYDSKGKKIKSFFGFDTTNTSQYPVTRVVPRHNPYYKQELSAKKQREGFELHQAARKEYLNHARGEELHNLSQMKRRKGIFGGLAALGLGGAGYAVSRNKAPAQQNPQVGNQ